MGQDWPIISLLRGWWPIFFIVFFETVLGREHSEKVLKKFIDNFYCWKLRYRCDSSQLYVKQLFRDRSDAMFYSRRLTSLFGPGPHKNFSCSDCYRNLVDRIGKPKLSKKTFPINVSWPIRIKQRLIKQRLTCSKPSVNLKSRFLCVAGFFHFTWTN